MAAAFLTLGVRKLRLLLAALFLALAVPAAVLVQQAYKRLAWETFHQQQQLAAELARRIDARLAEVVAAEEARPFTDYSFLTVAGDPASNFVQRSPLAAFPITAAVPGGLGYFQVDASGSFSSPILPPAGQDAVALGVDGAELDGRRERAALIERVLAANRLLRLPVPARPPEREDDGPLATRDGGPGLPYSAAGRLEERSAIAAAPRAAPAPVAPEAQGQAAFDVLSELGAAKRARSKQEADLKRRTMEEKAKIAAAPALADKKDSAMNLELARPAAPVEQAKRALRKELSALPEAAAPAGAGGRAQTAPAQNAVRIHTFESEVDAFEFARLDDEHFVLFRKVWRDHERYVQGLLVATPEFLQQLVGTAYRATTLSASCTLEVSYRGRPVARVDGASFAAPGAMSTGTRLYETRLSAPASDLELTFFVQRLPAGPGAALVAWLAAILAFVLCGGFVLLYRLALRQLRLARQQQDFISAVSHELKTPLTSIRMYGEMLQAGWAPEEKRREYYGYIHDEAERLTRLINNVLQLARMTRRELEVLRVPTPVGALLETTRTKIESAIAQAGAVLDLRIEHGVENATVLVDPDCFVQIVINLVDNAIKFSAKTHAPPSIELRARHVRDGIAFSVRDYGPGIPRDQLAKIFKLFYRVENELTRETVGTGIGLALVKQLTEAMGGRVDARNAEPGAEFTVTLAAA
jgi:signal transduction histidine kinase